MSKLPVISGRKCVGTLENAISRDQDHSQYIMQRVVPYLNAKCELKNEK